MRTSKPISTISYNTDTHLRLSLELLVEKELVSFWFWIQHKAEKEGQKDHKHVFIVPNATIDTNSQWFKELFIEPTPDCSIPLNVMPWARSKERDALLYALHEENYLSEKGLKRLYHYSPEHLHTNDREWLDEQLEIALASSRSCMEKLFECVEADMDFAQAMLVLRIPYGSMLSFMKVYNEVASMRKKDKPMRLADGWEYNPITDESTYYKIVDGKKVYPKIPNNIVKGRKD